MARKQPKSVPKPDTLEEARALVTSGVAEFRSLHAYLVALAEAKPPVDGDDEAKATVEAQAAWSRKVLEECANNLRVLADVYAKAHDRIVSAAVDSRVDWWTLIRRPTETKLAEVTSGKSDPILRSWLEMEKGHGEDVVAEAIRRRIRGRPKGLQAKGDLHEDI